jgi:hypothetical protein
MIGLGIGVGHIEVDARQRQERPGSGWAMDGHDESARHVESRRQLHELDGTRVLVLSPSGLVPFKRVRGADGEPHDRRDAEIVAGRVNRLELMRPARSQDDIVEHLSGFQREPGHHHPAEAERSQHALQRVEDAVGVGQALELVDEIEGVLP